MFGVTQYLIHLTAARELKEIVIELPCYKAEKYSRSHSLHQQNTVLASFGLIRRLMPLSKISFIGPILVYPTDEYLAAAA